VALTVVPRLPTRLLATQDGLVLDPDIWQGTTLLVATRTELFSAFDGASASFDKQNVALQHLLREPPIALFSTRRPF
jgi:maltooligosyltrehalose synthase